MHAGSLAGWSTLCPQRSSVLELPFILCHGCSFSTVCLDHSLSLRSACFETALRSGLGAAVRVRIRIHVSRGRAPHPHPARPAGAADASLRLQGAMPDPLPEWLKCRIALPDLCHSGARGQWRVLIRIYSFACVMELNASSPRVSRFGFLLGAEPQSFLTGLRLALTHICRVPTLLGCTSCQKIFPFSVACLCTSMEYLMDSKFLLLCP